MLLIIEYDVTLTQAHAQTTQYKIRICETKEKWSNIVYEFRRQKFDSFIPIVRTRNNCAQMI